MKLIKNTLYITKASLSTYHFRFSHITDEGDVASIKNFFLTDRNGTGEVTDNALYSRSNDYPTREMTAEERSHFIKAEEMFFGVTYIDDIGALDIF